MPYREILSTFAILLTLYSFYPYIRSIQKGETKPHYFSWLIWALTTTLSAFTELADHGGVGAYSVLLSGLLCFYVVYLSYQQERAYTISKIDWSVLLFALSSLVVWYVTSNPLWAAIILTTVDAFGFIPTFKKAYYYPWEENIPFYIIITVRNFFAIFAMENYSFTTMIFLWVINILGILLIGFIRWRRSRILINKSY